MSYVPGRDAALMPVSGAYGGQGRALRPSGLCPPAAQVDALLLVSPYSGQRVGDLVLLATARLLERVTSRQPLGRGFPLIALCGARTIFGCGRGRLGRANGAAIGSVPAGEFAFGAPAIPYC